MNNELIFIAGIGDNLRINDGNFYSRNYKQGYRVYSVRGIASSLLSESLGGLAGNSTMYLEVKNEKEHR